ncbi:MAG TPA: thermonuclease family protein, partial [Brumimicrobium sp.]|nr:thermonuclease family protein [Brumimicrobium sp.]
MIKFIFKLGFYLSLVLLFGACQSLARKDLAWYPVSRVVDGDTFLIDDGSEKGKRVRLIGVDTPETVHPRKPVEYYGREASDYVKNLLANQR